MLPGATGTRSSSAIAAKGSARAAPGGTLRRISSTDKLSPEALRDRPEAVNRALSAARTGIFQLTPSSGALLFPDDLGLGAADGVTSLDALLSALHATDRAPLQRALGTALEGGATGVHVEVRVLCEDGTERWLEMRGAASEPGGSTVTGTVSEVTERKEREAASAAADKMEAVGGLASGIAHDFNNLLTAVTGQMELLDESLDTGAEARVHIEGILKSVQRIAGITRKLLAVARRRKGAQRAPDLATLLDDLTTVMERTQADAEAEPRGKRQTPRPQATRSPPTILLVEDEPLVRDLGEKALSNLGYRVLTAGSASEATDAAAGHEGPIALLVTDVNLPDGSGIALAERLSRERAELRVLVVTGHSPDDVPGGTAHFEMLGKPFTLTELSSRVRGLLA